MCLGISFSVNNNWEVVPFSKIYDAGGSELWKDGSHIKRHFAGDDLTDALKTAPHGEDKVFQVPQVAELVSGWAQLRNPRRKSFSVLWLI